ncbi:MAG: type II toxin-antitoxin system RelE/ParE family toxin [Candidatus Competibacter sp.]
MSVRNFRLELSESARQDFRDILSFTLQTWGERQLVEYRQKLDAALQIIIENPQAGHARYGMMVYPVGRHVVFYQVDDDARTVYVVRILHGRMDALRHLT